MTALRVAVADDEALIRRWFQEVLPELGCEVVAAAENGQQLVDACRQSSPDLAILDIRMPLLDGIEAASILSAERPLPIILVSAYHDPDLIERAEESSAMAYLVKPVEKADLATAIAIARKRFEKMQAIQEEADRLRQSLEDRKLIEKAKGLLMEKTGLSEAEAHRRLQKIASERNLKLVEFAKMVIAAAPTVEAFRK